MKAIIFDMIFYKPTTSVIIITGIVVLATLGVMAAVLAPRPVFAIPPYTCSTCGPHESLTASALGELTCSNGINYPNTQINFNAIVPVKVIGPAKGSVTLTATTSDGKIEGTVTSGTYSSNDKTYSISGTSTSDNLCGVTDSPFTISGPTGGSVPISMTGKYDFKGTGDVKASHARA